MKVLPPTLVRWPAVAFVLLSMAPAMRADMKIPPMDQVPDAAWYNQSFLHTHMSVGFRDSNFDWPEVPAFRAQVQAVRPDAVQFHGGGRNAALLSREYGFHHVEIVSHAGTWRSSYEENPDLYQHRVTPDGSVIGRIRGGEMKKHLCFNSPGIDRWIVPEVYRKAARERKPSQIWIDENIVTVNLCWCAHCRSGFKDEYGMDVPVKADDQGWRQFARFHRDTFTRWQKKIYDAVQEGSAGTLVTFNHSYWLSQPETPPAFIRNLSADIHHGTQGMEVYGRYGSGIRFPFDIMPGLSAKTWGGKEPKAIDQVLTEIAVITANGGRWNIGEYPTGRAHPIDDFRELARRGAEFARSRKPWTFQTQSVPLVAVLQSASTHYARVLPENTAASSPGEDDYVWSTTGELDRVQADQNPGPTRIYFHNNRAVPDEITGAAEALGENHLHYDIINEDVLVKRLRDYRLLIVPEQHELRDDVAVAIDAFVRGGGSLLATGATVRSSLADVLGVTFAGINGEGDQMNLGDCAVTVPKIFEVTPMGARVEIPFRESGRPAVVRRHAGGGQAVYIAADLMGIYEQGSPLSQRPARDVPLPRAWLRQVFRELLPGDPLLVDAPPWISIYQRTRGNHLLVHVIDRTADWKENQKADQARPFVIDLPSSSKPQSVLLQPGDETPQWQWHGQSNRLQVSLAPDQIRIHRIVEVR